MVAAMLLPDGAALYCQRTVQHASSLGTVKKMKTTAHPRAVPQVPQ